MRTMLVDGNNILVRAAKATERVPLSSNGVPTAALLVFVNMLSRHVRAEAPTHLVVCWDGGRSRYRTDLYPAYKASRKDRSEHDETERPFGLAKEFLTLSGIAHTEREGWEADDLIACYWRRVPLDTEIVILSSDKDLLQLVGHKVEQVRVSSKPPDDRWDKDRVIAEYGVGPELLPSLMALTGDVSDGIPGIRGIGPKKAAAYIQEAGGGWFDKMHYTYGRLTHDQWQQAELFRRLVDLRDTPYATTGLVLDRPPAFHPTEPNQVGFPELLDYLTKYDLDSIRSRVLTGSLWTPEKEMADG